MSPIEILNEMWRNVSIEISVCESNGCTLAHIYPLKIERRVLEDAINNIKNQRLEEKK